MFVYCFDKETQSLLTRYGLVQLNPDAPAPYIFSIHPLVDLSEISALKGRYVVTNELIYI